MKLRHHTINECHAVGGKGFETWGNEEGRWFWHQTYRRLIGDELIDVVIPGAYGPFESREAAIRHATEILGPPDPRDVIAESAEWI